MDYDYSEGVIPATEVNSDQEGRISLTWDYASLKSGVPVGLILPAENGETRTATLPLDDILRLYQEIDQLREPTEKKLPVRATVQRIDLDGQLLENAVNIQATVQVIVLADAEWTEVPLFEVDSDTHISILPDIPEAVLVQMNNTLSFLKLRFDSNYIALKENNIQSVTSDGVFIYPHNNQYQLQWENKRITTDPAATSMANKAEIESVVKIAHASVISTLEGKLIYSILYKLHFTGEKKISFSSVSYFNFLAICCLGLYNQSRRRLFSCHWQV